MLQATSDSRFFVGEDRALSLAKTVKDPLKAIEIAIAFEKDTMLAFAAAQGARRIAPGPMGGTIRHARRLLLIAALLAAMTPPLSARGAVETPDKTWLQVGGTVYGCVPDNTGPLGGGSGYSRAVTSGKHVAASVEQLRERLASAESGQTVYIPGEEVLDFTQAVLSEDFVLVVPAGVTLAGERGSGGSRGALLKSDSFQTSPLILVGGPGVRITGLRIQGPDPGRSLAHWRRSFSSLYKTQREGLPEHEYFYRLPTSRGVLTEHDDLEVDNCELSGWSAAAIFLAAGRGHHVHHNHIHHNQRKGLGYGVSHGTAFSLIEYNLFGWNRHSIAGTGSPPSGYTARHNLEAGPSLSHSFDMHGGRDRNDGTQIAGTRIEIYSNTFLGRTRAIAIRGRPEEQALIYGNWFAAHFGPGPATIRWPRLADTVKIGPNHYGRYPPAVR